jgi:hypothetical protein
LFQGQGQSEREVITMENTMKLYKKILTDRRNHWKKVWENSGRVQDYHTFITYDNALDMFEYAEAGNYECLAQFDYLEEEE